MSVGLRCAEAQNSESKATLKAAKVELESLRNEVGRVAEDVATGSSCSLVPTGANSSESEAHKQVGLALPALISLPGHAQLSNEVAETEQLSKEIREMELELARLRTTVPISEVRLATVWARF